MTFNFINIWMMFIQNNLMIFLFNYFLMTFKILNVLNEVNILLLMKFLIINNLMMFIFLMF